MRPAFSSGAGLAKSPVLLFMKGCENFLSKVKASSVTIATL
jgi:hypothetical protein